MVDILTETWKLLNLETSQLGNLLEKYLNLSTRLCVVTICLAVLEFSVVFVEDVTGKRIAKARMAQWHFPSSPKLAVHCLALLC